MTYFSLLVAAAFFVEELRHFYRASRLRTAGENTNYFSVRARPLMFLFLFGWALPLSFVPIVAADLPARWLSLHREIASALPISTEMSCALVTAAISGWLSDRVGWHVPTLFGIALSIGAALISASATSFELFVLGRALTGLGYGLAWMGIQALVVRNTSPGVMTFAIANMTAGIFTGHMLGSFAGGWLSTLVGYADVFIVAAFVLVIPAGYAAWVFRPYFRAPVRAAEHSAPELRGSGTALFRDRSFVALLIASIVPFSIAQVGFLYYAMPLFLHDRGEATSTIGTVLAVYSVVYVFAAPRLAQFVDTHTGKKGFVALGGLVGGGALLVLLALPNLYGVVIATVILAIASSIGGAAQTSYALQLAAVRVAGPGFATGLQRSADKFGQMLGPLIVGSLYAGHGLITALVLTGAFYIVATVFYWLAARE